MTPLYSLVYRTVRRTQVMQQVMLSRYSVECQNYRRSAANPCSVGLRHERIMGAVPRVRPPGEDSDGRW
jgi:hypothetical protein